MNLNDLSCQPCGCDKGANHLCEQHRGVRPDSQYIPVQNAKQLVNQALTREVMEIGLKSGGRSFLGLGGAPTRATTLPTAGDLRKKFPVASGVMDYFPDALVAISNVSWTGNEQHNPGQELHWARGKSADEADTMIRHFLQRGSLDSDGVRHSAKMAWRALALLQKEIEAESKGEFNNTEWR